MTRYTALAFPPLVALFLLFPEIDLAVSGWFWSAGAGWLGMRRPFLVLLHDAVGPVIWGAFFLLLAGWLGSWAGRAPDWLKRGRRALGYLALAILLGPGLVVNVLFKDQWGRARPNQIEAFGGERQFTPAWVLSDQCQNNCAFVCGDASIGFVLLALAYVSRRPRRWHAAGLLAGGFLGLMRVAQGGHFFSDVVFSWYAVAFSAWLLARWLKPPPLWTGPGRVPATRAEK